MSRIQKPEATEESLNRGHLAIFMRIGRLVTRWYNYGDLLALVWSVLEHQHFGVDLVSPCRDPIITGVACREKDIDMWKCTNRDRPFGVTMFVSY